MLWEIMKLRSLATLGSGFSLKIDDVLLKQPTLLISSRRFRMSTGSLSTGLLHRLTDPMGN